MDRCVFKNGRFLLFDNESYYFHIGNCCVENGIIKSFDLDNYECNNVYDLEGGYVLPLFFNTHIHMGESIFRNIEGNWSLEKYLEYTEQYNNKLSKAEREKVWMESAHYTVRESIIHGTGIICAARSHMANEYGLKVLSGYPLMSSEKLSSFFEQGLEGYIKFKELNISRNVKIGIFLHSLYKTSPDYLQLSKHIAENGVDFFTVHVSESEFTRTKEKDCYKQNPIDVLLQYSLLNKNSIIVHGNYLSRTELEVISEREASISICPISNSFLGVKPLNPNKLNDLGIDWFVSTDGMATGRSLSLLKQLKYLKDIYPEIDYFNLFESITKKPGERFQINNYSGRIEAGCAADFVLIKYSKDNNNFLEWLIETQPQITNIVVNGKFIHQIKESSYE